MGSQSAVKRVVGAASVLACVLAGTVFVETASAAHVRCGEVVSFNVKLDRDVGPCPGDGLIVISHGVTIDLNGFRIIGANGPEERAGVVVRLVNGVTVTNTASAASTITGFDAGIMIVGGSSNKVRNLTLAGNVGNSPDCGLGDGLVTFNSRYNIIENNTIEANGPLSGMALVGPSIGNVVRNNRVRNNALVSPAFCGNAQDIGIRIEGPGANANTVRGNIVERNGLHGIAIHPSDVGFPPNIKNYVTYNTARNNGTSAGGSGIALMALGPAAAQRPRETVVQGNVVLENTQDGIQVGNGATLNRLVANRGNGNVRFDGSDLNTNCDANTWGQNVFVTVNQPCVANGGTGAVSSPPSPISGVTYEVTRHAPPPSITVPPTTLPPTTLPSP